MLARISLMKKKKEEEEKDRLDMNPHGFWGTLENLIGRERKRAACKSSFNDGMGMGKFMLALPALRSGHPSHIDDGFNVGLEPTLSDFHHFGDEDDEKSHRKKLSDRDYYDEDGKKKRRKKGKRKLVHKIITRKMVKDEEYRKQVDERIYKELAVPSVQEYQGPQYDISFNLPRVTAQLEKLMGTNVVRLTDRKYMQELQTRIKEDYCATLERRINNRVFIEQERQKHLILNGNYSRRNCPKRLKPLHSIVLSKEMEREKNLLLHGTGEALPPEMAAHPVFLTNIKTNNVVSKKRSKLKTIREKNAERLIKQGAKWEKERLLLEEQDRLNEIETKKRREKLLETEQLYTVEINAKGLDVTAIKSRKYTEPEINLKDFLLSEREAAVKKKFEPLDPFKDIQMMVAAKRRMRKLIEKDEIVEETEASKQEAAAKSGKLTPETPEEGYISANTDKGSIDKVKSQSTTPDPPTPKKAVPIEKTVRPPSARQTPEPAAPSEPTKTMSKPKEISVETKQKSEEKPIAPKKTKEVKILPKQKAATEGSSDVDNISDLSALAIDTHKETLSTKEHAKQLEESVKTEVAKGNMVKKPNIKLLHYEDPRIIQLKLTDNVKEMYSLADDIIIGDLKKK